MTSICDIFLPYQKTFFTNNKKRKIWISSRQVGKSFTVAGLLCYKALSRKNGLSLCISVNSRSASEIVRKCQQFAAAIKVLSSGSIDYTTSYDGVKFSNGSRVMSLPSTADSLRGFTANCVSYDTNITVKLPSNIVLQTKIGIINNIMKHNYFILYQITNKINGKIYIGKHKTSDLADRYFGSGTILRKAIEKYGAENFEMKILCYLNNQEELDMLERIVVNKDFVDDVIVSAR